MKGISQVTSETPLSHQIIAGSIGTVIPTLLCGGGGAVKEMLITTDVLGNWDFQQGRKAIQM